MRARIWTAVVAASIVVISASAADACSRSVSAKAAQTVVPSNNINQRLLEDAIRVEVNFHRCRAGLGKVSAAGSGLTKQAAKHSDWMAKAQKLSHQNTMSGSKTLKQRFKRSGVKFRTGSENIGMVHRYQIDNRRFQIVDASACQFQTADGQKLPAHSYASLARYAVDLWMNSPGHRKNILDRRVTGMSSAVAFDPKAAHCGRFWLTQNFVG